MAAVVFPIVPVRGLRAVAAVAIRIADGVAASRSAAITVPVAILMPAIVIVAAFMPGSSVLVTAISVVVGTAARVMPAFLMVVAVATVVGGVIKVVIIVGVTAVLVARRKQR